MENSLNLIAEVEKYATEIILSLPETMIYHNINHTRDVVKACTKIGAFQNLSEEEMEVLLVAAWMHDIGFVHQYEKHEESSVVLATEFMNKLNYPEEKAKKVKDAILSTRFGQVPQNIIEQVLHDADFSHLAKKSYFERSQRLHQEKEHFTGGSIPLKRWYIENIRLMSAHQYYTEYGQNNLEPRLLENMRDQQKLLKRINRVENETVGRDLKIDPEELKTLKKKLRRVEGRPDRGIETMFRLTSSNHIQLSSIADSKANILISVNSIIISIVIGSFLKSLDNHSFLLIPTYFMLSVCVITIVFSILVLRPNVTKGKFTRKDIEEKNTNLLFFGNFHSMERADYKWGMTQMMSNSEYLYSSLIDDIYFLGKVLGKKYRYLRLSYTIFMFGIIFSVLAYLISNYLYNPMP